MQTDQEEYDAFNEWSSVAGACEGYGSYFAGPFHELDRAEHLSETEVEKAACIIVSANSLIPSDATASSNDSGCCFQAFDLTCTATMDAKSTSTDIKVLLPSA